MKKQFTYTVNGQKFTFNTMVELIEAKRALNKKGINVDEHSIKVEVQRIEGQAKMTITKGQTTDFTTGKQEERFLDVVVEASNEELLWAIADIMERELQESFVRCPTELEGKYVISDFMSLPYEHGRMAVIKEDVKYVFKMAKKELDIK